MKEVVLALGRRGGKEFINNIALAYDMYELFKDYEPQTKYDFPNWESMCYLGLTYNQEVAQQSKSSFCSLVGGSHSTLKDRTKRNNECSMSFATDYDLENNKDSISVNFDFFNSSVIRGRNVKFAIFDDLALSDVDMYSIYDDTLFAMKFFKDKSMIIFNGTPAKEEGLFWDKHQESFDNEENMLMFNLYSSLINPSVDASFLTYQQSYQPDTFANEFGANFIPLDEDD
jgi:hypothetical protein